MQNEFDNTYRDRSAPVKKEDNIQQKMIEKIKELESNQSFLKSQLEELAKTFKLRLDRMQIQTTKTEQNLSHFGLDATQKIHNIHVKVNDQRKYDQKVQELIDRHANLIKSYEVRIQHLLKLMAEKDNLLLQTQAAINDAKMEITRLKRM
ncbi:MAG: hypothetical protein V4736_16170 [Bdellovibrionota bacterium]